MFYKKIISKIPKNAIIDIFLFFLIVSLGIKYTYGLENFFDIAVWDEAYYLARGIYLTNFGLSDTSWDPFYALGLSTTSWGPFYSLWHYFLSFFQSDSIAIYFTNYKILTIILPVLLFMVLRRNRIPRTISFLIAYFFLMSFGNIMEIHKVSHFALCVILISIFISAFFKQWHHRFPIIIIGSLLTSYIRPEFFVAFLIFLIIYLYKIIKEKSFLRKKNIIMILLLLISSHFIILGIPITKGKRGLLAFSQHFSLNWVKWNDSELSPWRRADADKIIDKNFGEVNSVYGAMTSNEIIFLKHIATNIGSSKTELKNSLQHPAILFPDNKYELLCLIIFFLLYASYQIYVKNNNNIIHHFRTNLKERREILIICTIYIIPVTLSIIIIYPRSHYLIMLLTMIILLVTSLLYSSEKVSNRKMVPKFSFLIIAAIVLMILTPNVSELFSSPNQLNIKIVKYLRSLQIDKKVNMLNPNGFHGTYVGPNYIWIPASAKDISFNKFLKRKNVNMIMLSGKLNSHSTFNSDTTWSKFLHDYKKYGFIKKSIPHTGFALLVKDNLIKKVSNDIH